MEERQVAGSIRPFSLRLAILGQNALPFLDIRLRIRIKMTDESGQSLSCVDCKIVEVDVMALWDTGSSAIAICHDVVGCTNQDIDHTHSAIVQIEYGLSSFVLVC